MGTKKRARPARGSMSRASLADVALAIADREGLDAVTLRALKDKRRGPGWAHSIKRRGPAGL